MQDVKAPSENDETLVLSAFLPYRLSVLSNTVSRAIADRYQREFGLSIWQWRIMAVLGESESLTASEVCARTAMDKVAVSRAVAGLEADGHVRRARDAEDGRAARLSLSRSGRKVYSQIVPLALAYEAQLRSGLTAREMDQLDRLLAKLASATSPDDALW